MIKAKYRLLMLRNTIEDLLGSDTILLQGHIYQTFQQQCVIMSSCMTLKPYLPLILSLKHLLLSIQNMMGGGRPAGGRHGSTMDTPS